MSTTIPGGPTPAQLVEAVDAAMQDARNDASPHLLLDRDGHEAVMSVVGMTGTKTRHLYNGLVRRLAALHGAGAGADGPRRLRYLEIGTWAGSSLVASLRGNEADVDAVVIDNWSEFNHIMPGPPPKELFDQNVRTLLHPSASLHVVEKDCFQVREADLPFVDFDIYLYDGPHSDEDHERAIIHFAGMIADVAVIVIDDWNWDGVRLGTRKGFEEQARQEQGLRVVHLAEEFTPGRRNLCSRDFWNGVGVFVVEKVKPTI